MMKTGMGKARAMTFLSEYRKQKFHNEKRQAQDSSKTSAVAHAAITEPSAVAPDATVNFRIKEDALGNQPGIFKESCYGCGHHRGCL
jgi:hypothetical protein